MEKEANENSLKKLSDEIKQKGEFKGKGADGEVFLYNGKIYKIYKDLNFEQLKFYSSLQQKFYSFLKKYFGNNISCVFPNGGKNIVGDENSSISCLDYVEGESFDIEDFHSLDERLKRIVKQLGKKTDKIGQLLYQSLGSCTDNKQFFSNLFKIFLIVEYPEFGENISNKIGFSNVKFLDGKFVITDCSDTIKNLVNQIKGGEKKMFEKYHSKK